MFLLFQPFLFDVSSLALTTSQGREKSYFIPFTQPIERGARFAVHVSHFDFLRTDA